jgi:YD repeat-containing protein
MKKYHLLFSLLSLMMLLCGFSFTAVAQDSQALNKKNLVVKEWNTDARGHRILDHQTIYNPDGKKIDETEYYSNGKQKWRKKFVWAAGDRMLEERVYDERNRLVDYKRFDYNEFGKKKTQYTYDPKGRLISTKVFEYITQDE